jgi:hypothetical protein
VDSTKDLRSEISWTQPSLTISRIALPGSKPLWTTVSLTWSPTGSSSKLAFDSGSRLAFW